MQVTFPLLVHCNYICSTMQRGCAAESTLKCTDEKYWAVKVLCYVDGILLSTLVVSHLYEVHPALTINSKAMSRGVTVTL